MTREELSKELVKLREKAGFKSGNSISKGIGTSQSYALKLEAGEHNFKLDFLFKYLKVVRMRLLLVSKDGDTKKNKLIKQPGALSQYINQMLRLQFTNPKNIAHKGMRGYMVNKIVDGDLSVGVDGFLQFVDLLGYDVSFQPNEIMEGRVEAAKKAMEDIYKPLSDDEIKKERLRIGEIVKAIRKASGKKCKDINQNMQSLRELEGGDKKYTIKTLFNYLKPLNVNMYAVSIDDKVMVDMDNIGAFIKSRREHIRHNSILLADRLGVTNITILTIENGRNFTINNCIQLFHYFGYKITIE
jgi:transcriptional regulator with XRE-family HTH domain